MENKEHIDRLYQEKLKDFEVNPHPKVWKNIEESLQKKKRRVLPFWWISGGAAATLIIGLLLFPFSSDKHPNDSNFEEIIITESEQIPPINTVEELVVEKQESPQKNKTTKKVLATQNQTQKTIEKPLKSVDKKEKESSTFNRTAIAVVVEKDSKENEAFRNNQVLADNNSQKTKISKGKIKKGNTKIDTTTQFTVPKNTQKHITLNEKDNEINKKSLNGKWSITPSIAFLNSGSFSKSSPLGARLDNNPISGENTKSYGIKMGYKIDEKWEVQSGVHLQEVAFNTQNVTFKNSSLDSEFNINYYTGETLVLNPSPNNPIGLGFMAKDATVNQSFSYIEIPLEIKYTLLKRQKFSTQLVTGISSLFLSKNEIEVSSTNFSGSIGEANNLNTINFSGNIGLDINYQLFEKLQLNVSPMFKQQFNTFSKSANGFKPYSIGIYTGIRYEF